MCRNAALGKILEDRGAYDQATPVLEEAVRLQSTPGAASPDLAASLSELANTQFYAGHYDASAVDKSRPRLRRHRLSELGVEYDIAGVQDQNLAAARLSLILDRP